jgi:hypothetical protein
VVFMVAQMVAAEVLLVAVLVELSAAVAAEAV